MIRLNKKQLKDCIIKSYSHGSIQCNMFYHRIFGEYPSVYAFNLKEDDQIQVSAITNELLSKLFPNYIFTWGRASDSAQTTSAIDDYEEPFDDSYLTIGGSYAEASINVVSQKYICCIYSGQIAFYYRDMTIEELRKEVQRIESELPKKDTESKPAKVSLICFDGRDYYTTESSIKRTTVDVDLQYNNDFKPEYEKIESFLDSRESGLVLLWGAPGTGKTTLIRHLITNIPREYILVPPGMMPHIAAPEFISFIISHKNSVFILEDCEQLLIDRQISSFNNGISTILNMSDGLLSDIFNLKFICTFNAEITAIDQALMRPGRCYANYKFDKLCKEKVIKLAEFNNIELKEPKDMALSDLFNNNFEEKPKENKKIGF